MESTHKHTYPHLSFQMCIFKSHEPLTYTHVLDRHWQVPCKLSAGLAGDDWCSPFNVHQRFQILLYTTNHKSLLWEKPWDSAVSSLCVIVKKKMVFSAHGAGCCVSDTWQSCWRSFLEVKCEGSTLSVRQDWPFEGAYVLLGVALE